MKNENRVRAKSSPAKVRIQTKKLPEPLPYELRSASIFLAAFYKERCKWDRKPAFNDLLGMYHLVKRDPALKRPACFLNILIEGNGILNDLYGSRDLPDNYDLRQGELWIVNYYERLNALNYADAIFECRGLEQLLRGNRRFSKTADALRQIIFGHTFMLNFVAEILGEEKAKGGAQ